MKCKKYCEFNFFSPCSGIVISGYSKTSTDKSLITHLAKASIPYRKFKKMYEVDSREFYGKIRYFIISKTNFLLYLEYDSDLSLRFVRMHFYATTFDRITKDRAAKFVDMFSAIGGTMGLLTGFSIISGVEMVYFASKIILKILKDRLNKNK